MKKGLLFIIMILLFSISLGVLCLAAPPDSSYELVFSDEFEGDSLNLDTWYYRTGGRYGGVNKAENVRVENGSLLIDYKKVGNEFSGGGVHTTFTTGYGYYEVRARVFDGVNGLHTSFWTTGSNTFAEKPENEPLFPSSLEIDIFEIDSREDGKNPNISHGTHVFYRGKDSSFRERYTELDVTEWFVMGMERLPDRLNFYINGELVSTQENLDFFGYAYTWLTALASPDHYLKADGTYNIDLSKIDENGLFGSSEFDYFRYYQRPMQGTNMLSNGNFEYNRAGEDSIPRHYVLKGDLSASATEKTPFAYDEFIVHSHKSGAPYELLSGQELCYLLPGKYTFKGQFKASEGLTSARVVVYDQNNNVLAEKNIPQSNDWTELCITDIPISNYAFVTVESSSEGGTVLSMDALEFYLQSGTPYTLTATPEYEKYMGEKVIDVEEYEFEHATDYAGDFKASGIMGYYLNENNPDAFVEWEFEASKDGYYTPQWYHLPRSDNPLTQTMTVILPDGTESSVVLDAQNGVEGYVSLGDFELKKEEILTIRATHDGTKKNMRITKLRVPYTEELFYSEATILQLNNRIFVHQKYPYLFEETLTPYKQDDVYYIPYQMLKSTTGIDLELSNDTTYVTDAQLKKAGIQVSVSEDYLYLTPHDITFTAESDTICREALIGYTSPETVLQATYSSYQGDAYQQTVYPLSEAYFYGDWLNSYHVVPHKYADDNTSYAEWTIDAPKSGTYTLEYYSPNRINAASGVALDLYANGVKQKYTLNQTDEEKIGWYTLGDITFTEEDKTLKLHVQRESAQGHLRVYAIRLVPTVKTETFIGERDVLLSEYYAHNSDAAEKVGGWIQSGGIYSDCIAVRNTEKDAKITWTVTPKTEDNYSIQLFNPRYFETATEKAIITLTVNGETCRYEWNQKPENAENNGAGWYDLGTFALKPSDTIKVSMINGTESGWLRAKALRLVPENSPIYLVGDFDEPLQELHTFTEATLTGTWGKSNAAGIKGSYYTPDNATATWNFAPSSANKYSIQIYMPCSAGNSAAKSYVTLSVNGISHKFLFNQSQDTETYTGWYELCVQDLPQDAEISITIGKNDGSNLRAKAVRLIPYPGCATTAQNGTVVTANIGTLSNHHNNFLFAEFDSNGILQSITTYETAPAVDLTLTNANNKYQLFFWGDYFKPVSASTGTK
ncbi:MAG: family 16 glycosylhydrolase [Clostridia bacterium]|nr:family 16 glycosylhydrolase [Clostridia bacterium]